MPRGTNSERVDVVWNLDRREHREALVAVRALAAREGVSEAEAVRRLVAEALAAKGRRRPRP